MKKSPPTRTPVTPAINSFFFIRTTRRFLIVPSYSRTKRLGVNRALTGIGIHLLRLRLSQYQSQQWLLFRKRIQEDTDNSYHIRHNILQLPHDSKSRTRLADDSIWHRKIVSP